MPTDPAGTGKISPSGVESDLRHPANSKAPMPMARIHRIGMHRLVTMGAVSRRPKNPLRPREMKGRLVMIYSSRAMQRKFLSRFYGMRNIPQLAPLSTSALYEESGACCACSWGLRSVIPRGLPRGCSFSYRGMRNPQPPYTMARKAFTAAGSKRIPACVRICSRTFPAGQAARYGRSDCNASQTSTTANNRAARGMKSSFSPRG